MRAIAAFLLLGLTGCDATLGVRGDAGTGADAPDLRDAAVDVASGDGAVPPSGCFLDPMPAAMGGGAMTIDDAVAAGGCSTAVVRPLSEQLIGEIDCLAPGAMARIDDIGGLTLTSTALPWLQRPARAALADAVADGGGGLSVNSTLRTLPQQLMLYRWYLSGLCGITLAARPGTSPHESGLAIDTSEYTAWRPELEGNGWRWHGAGDLVHFDYVAGGAMDLEGLSVLAFQRLWNRNHPEDRIAEDGAYGPQTEGRLRQTPISGFATGAMCDPPPPPRAPLTLDWSLDAGRYELVASADDDVAEVAFTADGRALGAAGRSPLGTYVLDAGACLDGALHVLEIAGGPDRAVALLEAEAENAIYVRPRGGTTYEVGLERPAADVAAIEVSADGFAITDAETGEVRASRRAVLHTYSATGLRRFELRAYAADGALLETRTFEFTLR
jgi:hypothetical protein